METVHTIESNISKLRFGYWNSELEEFIPIDGSSEKKLDAANRMGCSVELVDTLVMLVVDIKDLLSADLADIWRKVDK